MKKVFLITIGILGLIMIQATYAQSCRGVHNFCVESLPEEEQGKEWSFDNQSKSATFEKGKTYEMSFIAYRDYIYRITTCTDMLESKVNFEVYHNELVRKEMDNGVRLIKEKILIFDNKTDSDKAFYKFRTEKTEKIYVKINVPNSGESKKKEFRDSEFVCVGVLLQHKKGQKVGF
jgi:hypothetical protein